MDRAEWKMPVEVIGLKKRFGPHTILNGIDLTLAPDETLAVLGKSGTGKSVLLRLLVGLQPPDSGSIRICGQDLSRLSLEALNELRKRVGFLFQQAALYDSLTIEQNVEFPLVRNTRLPERERRDKVRQLLFDVGLQSDLDKLPSEISGGMQKRVGLARALALDPELLLLDEPTSGLDPITAAGIGNLIFELKRKRKAASIVVTHDVPGARAFADRFVLLNEGEIVGDGSYEDLRRNRDEFVSQFIGGAAEPATAVRG